MWVVNALTALAYIIVFAQNSLYAAMGLQIYYLSISFYGFFTWKKEGQGSIVYKYAGKRDIVVGIVIFTAFFLPLLTFLKGMTGDPIPAADAFCTALSVVATLWLSRLYIHQWLLWLVVDIVYVGLFIHQGLVLTAILYFLYSLSALYGFYHWKNKGVLLK